jgi:uncharacterized protein (TIGR00106 family)
MKMPTLRPRSLRPSRRSVATSPARSARRAPTTAGERRQAGGTRRTAGGARRKTVRRHPREVLLEFSMSPFDKGASLSKYVARSLDIIDHSGIPYRMNPMGTVIEGTWDEVLRVVTRCFERMRADCDRISVAVKIDYRKGRTGRLTAKVASVEKRLGRKVVTG